MRRRQGIPMSLGSWAARWSWGYEFGRACGVSGSRGSGHECLACFGGVARLLASSR